MSDILAIAASVLGIVGGAAQLELLLRRTPRRIGGDPPRLDRVQRALSLALGSGAVFIILGAAAFLFSRGEVKSSISGPYFPDSSSFPEASASFSLLAVACGLIGVWLGAGVKQTNEGLAFSLAFICLGIITVMFTSSLPDEVFSL